MTPEAALEVCHFTLVTAAKLSAPYLLATVIIGVLMNILQTVTQLKDQSLSFIPKVAVVGVVGLLALPWELTVLMGYFNYIIELFGSV
ncbi:flagellar biosynthetic protein FliQ [Pontiella agarivorans]|uniref:Flagellar biosynthetic protein FliQ n=1 Tax=Pontiella agarivorans TaxID=3038953 RepID=A0ABU5MT06_9BACT|nr:flagellar biosynthetic protein FliQ [Pontiella agarivorans]MDZ8117266.1 flagellar biosynthetic protein FliQ [Pontiella agarivorans]